MCEELKKLIDDCDCYRDDYISKLILTELVESLFYENKKLKEHLENINKILNCGEYEELVCPMIDAYFKYRINKEKCESEYDKEQLIEVDKILNGDKNEKKSLL